MLRCKLSPCKCGQNNTSMHRAPLGCLQSYKLPQDYQLSPHHDEFRTIEVSRIFRAFSPLACQPRPVKLCRKLSNCPKTLWRTIRWPKILVMFDGGGNHHLIDTDDIVDGQQIPEVEPLEANCHGTTSGHHASSFTKPPKAAPKPLLINVPTSERYFWKPTLEAQLNQELFDKVPEQKTRPLPKNELLVMALNEISVHYRYGFSCYTPSKDAQKRESKEELCPSSRVASPAG